MHPLTEERERVKAEIKVVEREYIAQKKKVKAMQQAANAKLHNEHPEKIELRGLLHRRQSLQDRLSWIKIEMKGGSTTSSQREKNYAIFRSFKSVVEERYPEIYHEVLEVAVQRSKIIWGVSELYDCGCVIYTDAAYNQKGTGVTAVGLSVKHGGETRNMNLPYPNWELTSTELELESIAQGLLEAKRLGAKEVLILNDCTSSVSVARACAHGNYRDGWYGKIQTDIHMIAAQFDKVHIHWIPREMNKEADHASRNEILEEDCSIQEAVETLGKLMEEIGVEYCQP